MQQSQSVRCRTEYGGKDEQTYQLISDAGIVLMRLLNLQ